MAKTPGSTPPQIPGEEPQADQPAGAEVDPRDVEVAQLREELGRCYKAMQRAGVPLPSAAPSEEELPDAADIDASAIDKAVLTKQGWVLPNGGV
jgi:hypothetical protein